MTFVQITFMFMNVVAFLSIATKLRTYGVAGTDAA